MGEQRPKNWGGKQSDSGRGGRKDSGRRRNGTKRWRGNERLEEGLLGCLEGYRRFQAEARDRWLRGLRSRVSGEESL